MSELNLNHYILILNKFFYIAFIYPFCIFLVILGKKIVLLTYFFTFFNVVVFLLFSSFLTFSISGNFFSLIWRQKCHIQCSFSLSIFSPSLFPFSLAFSIILPVYRDKNIIFTNFRIKFSPVLFLNVKLVILWRSNSIRVTGMDTTYWTRCRSNRDR